jgi:predicted amidophosphoribosyltransferase
MEMNEINREKSLMETFPLEDGTTYIQSLDKFNSVEDRLCPKCQSIIHSSDGLCWKCLIESNK